MNLLRENGMFDFMNFREAVNKVLKKWYEQRIQEETDRNRKLRELHDNLTKIKILREGEALKMQQNQVAFQMTDVAEQLSEDELR